MYALDTGGGYDKASQDIELSLGCHDTQAGTPRSDKQPDLRALMKARNIATLSGMQVQHPEEAALLCLKLALSHPESVVALLWDPDIAKAAKRLLAEDHQNRQAQAQQEMLARLLLEAGHHPGSGLSANVQEALLNRKKQADDYLAQRNVRHHGFSWVPGDEPARKYRPGQPCPYRALPKESMLDRNGTVDGAWCRHMSLVVLSEFQSQNPQNFKNHLRHIAEGRVSFNTAELERQHERNMSESRHRRVQFTPENFGRVLVKLFAGMRPGDRSAHPVGWWMPANLQGAGHVMCVLLEKAEDGLNKVWLYDPSVSGNAMHVRELPEVLQHRPIADFDTLSYIEGDTEVLSMDIGDERLAKAWAGQFVARFHEPQMASFMQALAHGTVHEMHAAMRALGDMAPWQEPRWQETLSVALHIALSNGHTEAIETCGEWLKDVDLEGWVWLAERNGVTGFSALLQFCDDSSRLSAAWAYLNLLSEVSRQMDPQAKKALYRVLYAVQTCRPCWTGFLCRVYSREYKKLKVDPDFHQAFERFLRVLKSG